MHGISIDLTIGINLVTTLIGIMVHVIEPMPLSVVCRGAFSRAFNHPSSRLFLSDIACRLACARWHLCQPRAGRGAAWTRLDRARVGHRALPDLCHHRHPDPRGHQHRAGPGATDRRGGYRGRAGHHPARDPRYHSQPPCQSQWSHPTDPRAWAIRHALSPRWPAHHRRVQQQFRARTAVGGDDRAHRDHPWSGQRALWLGRARRRGQHHHQTAERGLRGGSGCSVRCQRPWRGGTEHGCRQSARGRSDLWLQPLRQPYPAPAVSRTGDRSRWGA